MSVLVTGGSGFIGKELCNILMARGDTVYSLSRHPGTAETLAGVIPLRGDVLLPDFGLEEVPESLDRIYHLAGLHNLGDDNDGQILKTNIQGTENALGFCDKNHIPHFYFCSSAYTEGKNPYEWSKIVGEAKVTAFCQSLRNIKLTIFKPSIVLGTEDNPFPGHFSQFVSLIIRTHRRIEIIRRSVEGTLRLPVIEPVFRIPGNPEGKLNLITVDDVAEAMASIEDEGTFWLTNPDPPDLKTLCEWVGEFAKMNIKIIPSFEETPIEAAFQKMGRAFIPYLKGDDYPSDIKDYTRITKPLITNTLRQVVL